MPRHLQSPVRIVMCPLPGAVLARLPFVLTQSCLHCMLVLHEPLLKLLHLLLWAFAAVMSVPELRIGPGRTSARPLLGTVGGSVGACKASCQPYVFFERGSRCSPVTSLTGPVINLSLEGEICLLLLLRWKPHGMRTMLQCQMRRCALKSQVLLPASLFSLCPL